MIDRNQKNLSALCKIFPRLATFLCDKNPECEWHEKIESKGFMPLSLEFLYETNHDGKTGRVFSLMHFFTQNGDLMRDPDIEFEVLDGAMFSISFRQDGAGGTDRQYMRGSNGALECDKFFTLWLRNLKAQGFAGKPSEGPAPKASKEVPLAEALSWLPSAEVVSRAAKPAPAAPIAPICDRDAARAAQAFRAGFQGRHAARNGRA